MRDSKIFPSFTLPPIRNHPMRERSRNFSKFHISLPSKTTHGKNPEILPSPTPPPIKGTPPMRETLKFFQVPNFAVSFFRDAFRRRFLQNFHWYNSDQTYNVKKRKRRRQVGEIKSGGRGEKDE
jgi:hypothetical protein